MPEKSTLAASAPAWRTAWALGALCAAAGCAWVLASDAAVEVVSHDPGALSDARELKGLLGVALAALGVVAGLCWSRARVLAACALTGRALERQEAQFRQLHEGLGHVVWLASAHDGAVRYVSPAVEEVYGVPGEAFMRDARRWLDAVVEEDRARAEASGRALYETGEARCEYRIRRPDGGVRWIADRKRVIRDEEGRARLIGGIAEDITASRELEAVRRRSHEELERRVAERTAELERVNAELEAFTRTAAHDLKAPLHNLAGLSGLLQSHHRSGLGEDGCRLVQQIGASATKMAALVDDLLTLSRVQQSALRLDDVDVAALAAEVVDELRRREPGREVAWQAPAPVTARADAGLLRSLLVNLLGNAWKFTACAPGAQVAMTAHRDGDAVRLSVRDNGIGFDVGRAEGLFTPFRRFHAQREFPGTGLGLATCERIVRRHGGRIHIDSTPGRGTVVTVTLPVTAAASAPPPRA